MGRDGLIVGVRIIRKFVFRPLRICYRSVYKHPFVVGILLLLLFVYRSSPFLFSILVSASPVLVCTAVLLGTLLSFGEHSVLTAVEEGEEITPEIAELRTSVLGSSVGVESDESYGKESGYTGLSSEIVDRSFNEEPLLNNVGKVEMSETDDDLVISSMPSYHVSREVQFGEQLIHEADGGLESLDIGEMVSISDQKTRVQVGSDVSVEDVVKDMSFEAVKVQAENIEDYNLVEGSIDLQMRNNLELSMAVEEKLDEDVRDSPSSYQKEQAESLEDDEITERSIDVGIMNQSGSCAQFDVLNDRLSTIPKILVDSCEDYISAEGSVDAQIGSPLELSLGSWNHVESDPDGNDVSDSGSDGAESSSPDASMADIMPLLDELHPLLEDESMQYNSLSRQGSGAAMETSLESVDGSIQSEDESDQRDEEDAGDIKSNGEDDNEPETLECKEDPAKSAILWTEDDQKNLMDLGTSELERNQRLESLIARRRARRMMTDKNLIDLEGMDLPFPVAPISTSRYNPFDNHHDSYADLGLPPIPGSAPSVMSRRPNPFDLPYDSSEEKPDLTGDGFQEEFMELTQRESSTHQREALFRRNETFSMGSSVFDFGRHIGGEAIRPSRFRPYFIPERTDSDVMSYSSYQRQYSDLSESRTSLASLQRQSSELSESKASYVSEIDSMLADLEEKKLVEHETIQEREPTHETDHASNRAEHDSQSFEDVDSLTNEKNEQSQIERDMPVTELLEVKYSSTTAFHSAEAGEASGISLSDNSCHLEAECGFVDNEASASEIEFEVESLDVNLNSPTKVSASTNCNNLKDSDIDGRLPNSQVHHLETSDIPVSYSSETSVSDIPSKHSQEDLDFSCRTVIDEGNQKKPLYDSSPMAMKKNLSSSSISSDLQRENSEIDLYHVQRDLFASEDSNHDEDGEHKNNGNRLETTDKGFAGNNAFDITEHSMTMAYFPGINSQPSEPPGLPDTEYDVLLSSASLSKELPLNQLSNKMISADEAEHETRGGQPESHHEAPFCSSVDDITAVHGYKSLEDPNLALQEKQVGPVSPFSLALRTSEEVEFKEEPGMRLGGKELFPASISNRKDDCTSDDTQSLQHGRSIHDPVKQESSIIHLKLEEYGQVNKVHETANVLKVQEPESNMRSDLVQNEECFSRSEEYQNISVPELAVERNVEQVSETRFAEATEEYKVSSVGDELILHEENTDTKELDEELLSELDAVGDFSVTDTTSYLKGSYLDATVNSDLPEELHSSSTEPFGHGILLVDTADIQNTESSARVMNASNLASINESVSDSDIGDADAASLVLADQSVVDKDATLKKENKEAKDSVDSDSVQVGLLTVETEPGYMGSRLVAEATEPMSRNAEVLSLFGSVWNVKESTAEGSDSDLASLEEENLDSNRMDVQSVVSVDTEALEGPGDFDALETDNSMSNVVKALQTTAESDIGSVESLPFRLDRNIPDTQKSLLVETGIESSVQSQDPIERFYSVDTKFFQAYIDEFEKQLPPVFESDTLRSLEYAPEIERAVSIGSESMQNATDVKENQHLPVPEGTDSDTLHSLESAHEMERVVSLSSQLMENDTDVKEIQHLPIPEGTESESLRSLESAHELERGVSIRSKSMQIDTDVKDTQHLHVPEESGAVSSDKDQKEKVVFMQCESLTMDADIEEIHKYPVTGPGTTDPHEFEDQTELCGSLESESLPSQQNTEELRGSPVDSSIGPHTDLKNHFETAVTVESEQVKMDGDVQGIQTPPATETSDASAAESGGLREILSETEVVEVPDLEDYQLASQQQPKSCDETEDSKGVPVDSSNSEDQFQRVASQESEQLKPDGDLKGIQEHPVVEASIASYVNSEVQSEFHPQTETIESQDLEDPLTPQQQPEECVPEIDDFKVVHASSSPTLSQSTINELGDHASNKIPTEDSSQVEEERPHESHLEISSTSSSSSSADSDEEYCMVQRNVDE